MTLHVIPFDRPKIVTGFCVIPLFRLLVETCLNFQKSSPRFSLLTVWSRIQMDFRIA